MIPISKPFLGEAEAAAAREVILSGWVTQGPRVKAFEEAFSKFVGSRFACAVSSCTTALHMALMGVGVKPGDVVVTVSHSFIATANAVRHCGAEPVFVDIDPETYNMDPGLLRKLLQEECVSEKGQLFYRDARRIAVGESPLAFIDPEGRTFGRVAAVLPVHQMGFPCEIGQILSIAAEFGLPVVEDAACAAGSEIISRKEGTRDRIGRPHGMAACFSFHPRKVLTTGDGGMITTDDPDLDARFRLLRQHGMSVPDTIRHYSDTVIFEAYRTTGYNYRMTDIQAAVGVEQLKRLERFVAERRELAREYESHLSVAPGLKVLSSTRWAGANWQSYPVRLTNASPGKQKNVMQFLLEKGIATRRGIMNAHQEHAYLQNGWSLPESEKCRDSVILLPLYNGLYADEVREVCAALKRTMEIAG